MEVARRFLPRNETVARTVLFVLTAVASVVTMVFAVAFPSHQTAREAGLTVAGCAGALALATAMVVTRRTPAWVWAVYPFVAIALITLLDLRSRDASVIAQVFFFFPALYAGALLRRFAVVSICAAATAGEGMVTFGLLSPAAAATDFVFVSAALCASAALLLHGGERTDRLIAQLERQAAVDPLTGLLTRRVLDSAITSALGCAGRDGGTALLVMDVDRFKTINDVHGHPAGDAVLQQLAAILLDHSRRGDVVSRLGGDEIAVLLPGCSLAAAERRAEEIRTAVHDHVFDITAESMAAQDGANTLLRVTLSIGIAHYATEAEDVRALYASADASLYEAKKLGRDRVGLPRLASPVPA